MSNQEKATVVETVAEVDANAYQNTLSDTPDRAEVVVEQRGTAQILPFAAKNLGTSPNIRASSAVPLVPNLEEARRFLAVLDPDATQWTFLTFHDREKGKLVRELHGTLEEHAEELARLQQRGAGVFVTINETNLQGREAQNIVRIRAVFADLDGVPLEVVKKLRLEPHITVESSPDRWHVYYRTQGVTIERFTGIQKGLIALFGSDHKVHDLPRVMRLPGFWHQKREPFMTRIHVVNDPGRLYGLPDFATLQGATPLKATNASNVAKLPGSEQMQRALELGREAARRSHAEPTEGRHGIALCLGWDCRRANLDEKAATTAARTFAAECRAENSDGEHAPFGEKRAIEAVLNAYQSDKDPGPPAKKAAVSQVDQLVRLARSAEIWRIDQETYFATVVEDGREEHVPTNSVWFRRWLGREYFRATNGKTPGAQAVTDAIKGVEAISTTAPIHDTARRVGAHSGKLYVDLCCDERRAVEIDAEGWRIIQQPPVRFIRSAGMLPLPLPVKGGSMDELRPFINTGDAGFKLLISVMLSHLRPVGPFPVLGIHGEHGTAKSTTSRFVRALTDPHQADLRRPPREDRDLVTAANASWVLAFDNLSSVPQWMADSFCMLATGGSYTARAMRTDYDEVILAKLNRPLILNGIDDIDKYADLTSRTVRVVLDPIPEEERKTDEEIKAAFEAARPRLLGAIYTAVSSALRNLPTTKMDRMPRMADFAKWVTAAEEGLGWAPGTFMDAFDENQETAVLDALSGDTVAQCVVGLVQDLGLPPDAKVPCWQGTTSELYKCLDDFVSEETRTGKFWPGNPTWLSKRLRKIAPGLRAAGINLDLNHRDAANRTLIAVYQTGELRIEGRVRGGGLPSEGAVTAF